MTPNISVLILTYNREAMVREAVASVLAQTYQNFELLVIDDGSTDATLESLGKIKDARLRLVAREHTGHIAAMRHHGLKKARGAYAAFLDSDDTWDPIFLASLLAPLENKPRLAFTFANVRISAETRETILYDNYMDREHGCFHGLITGQLVIYPSSVLFRRDKEMNWDPSLRVGDHEFLTRLARQGSAYQLAACLVNVRRHASNMSDGNTLVDLDEFIQTVRRHYAHGHVASSVARPVIAKFSYQLGMVHLARRQKREARFAFLRSFRYRYSVRALVRLFQSFL